MTAWTEQIDYEDFLIIRAPDWNKIVRDDQRFLYECRGFRWSPIQGIGPSPANGVQTIGLDFSGAHTEVNGGTYTLSYGPKTSTPIPWNATDAEIESVIQGSFDPELTIPFGRFGATRSGVDVAAIGDGTINDGFTLTFDTARINPDGPILEMVMTNVSLTFDGSPFDGDVEVVTVAAADNFGEIAIAKLSAVDFSSPSAVTPSRIGDFPGYWNIHTQILTGGGFGDDEANAQIRLNGERVAYGRAMPTGGIGSYIIEMNWAGLIVEDDSVGFFIDTSAGTGFFSVNNSTWFEGFYSGEVVE